MSRVLIVEDDPSLATALRDGFEYGGYSVEMASDGEEGFRIAQEHRLDLIILDVVLPKKSGFEVCSELKEASNSAPIIILSARSEEQDKVKGLKLGADDYVVKPFSFVELMARAEALLRRTSRSNEESQDYDDGDLRVHFKEYKAFKNGHPLQLSVREFEMLKFFINRRGQVVTREQLLRAVWGYDRFLLTRTVDVHVAKLRSKIEDNPGQPRHLATVHGNGYKFLP